MDDPTVADIHRDVVDRRVVGHEVARPQLAQRDGRKPGLSARGARNPHTCLRPGPVGESGTVKRVWTGGAVDVRRALLGPRCRGRDPGRGRPTGRGGRELLLGDEYVLVGGSGPLGTVQKHLLCLVGGGGTARIGHG